MGRFDPRNALDTLLDAARILADEGRDFVLQVVGDGPLRPKYHRQAKALGVDDRIEWLGLLDKERPAALPRGHRVRRALRAGLVRGGAAGGDGQRHPGGVRRQHRLPPGHPRRGCRGASCPRATPPRLAAGIAELLDDPATRADWGARGRELAVEQYAWPTVARRVEDLYREIIEGKRGAPPTPPVGLRFNLRRNPVELARNLPRAVLAGFRVPRRRRSEPGRGDAPEGG